MKVGCQVRGQKRILTFHIVDTADKPMLGLDSCLECKLINKIDWLEKNVSNFQFISKDSIIKSFKDIFENLGQSPGQPCKLFLKEGANPVLHASRRIPKNLIPKFKSTIESLERANVICKETNPTDWINKIVITEKKDGKLRVCLDPRDLNKNF